MYSRRVRIGARACVACCFGLAALLTLAPDVAGESIPRAPASSLATVDSLLAAGALPEAAKTALAALREWGNDPLYGWQLAGRAGTALVAAGRPLEAVAHLEAAIGAQPGDGALRHQLGLALAAAGRRGRALAEFEQAMALDPAAVAPRLEAARMRSALGDVDGAAHVLAAASDACGGCPAPDRLLATVMLAAGRPGQAVAPLQRLLAAGPDEEVRRTLLAALSQAREDSALLQLVAGREPSAWTADEWRQAVQAEARLGRAEHAGQALALAAVQSPPAGLPLGEDLFWANVAASLLAAGQPLRSLEAADRALALNPGQVVYLTNKAAALVALGRHDEARQVLAEARADGQRAEQAEAKKEQAEAKKEHHR